MTFNVKVGDRVRMKQNYHVSEDYGVSVGCRGTVSDIMSVRSRHYAICIMDNGTEYSFYVESLDFKPEVSDTHIELLNDNNISTIKEL